MVGGFDRAQFADFFYDATVWLFLVLLARRCAEVGDYGGYLSRRCSLHRLAAGGLDPDSSVPALDRLAAEFVLWIGLQPALVEQRGKQDILRIRNAKALLFCCLCLRLSESPSNHPRITLCRFCSVCSAYSDPHKKR